MKKYNFSPGPANLSDSVLELTKNNILEYKDTGISILEISHRSEEFQLILHQTKENLSKLLHIPKNYHILLLQGGATFHNTFIAQQYRTQKSLTNLVTGTWGQNTYEDFLKIRKIQKIDLECHKLRNFLEQCN